MAPLIFLGIFIVQAIAEKGILLNDPDLIQSQVCALEKKVEDIVGKYSDLSSKYNTLLTKTNSLYTQVI